MTMSIIRELFENCIKASDILGEVYSNLSSLENIWDEYQIYQTHEDE